jgi:hypothetical protein
MASPGIISSTRAVEVSIHAVAPLSMWVLSAANKPALPNKRRRSVKMDLFTGIFISKKD